MPRAEREIYIPGMTLALVEREVILAAVRHFNGSRTAACRSLGISMGALRYKLKAYAQDGLKVPASPKHQGRSDA